MIDPAKPLRVLVSEGSSTSAREAITILGLSGHHVEVCDPSAHCLARFSRFVRKFHRCPGLRNDPAGFLAFVEQMLARERFDVLLPTHEQGFLFARVRGRALEGRIGLALPSFESYRAAHSKAGFSRLLDQWKLPQPPTRIVKSARAVRDAVGFPAVIKTSIGTASRGIWFVRNADDLEMALRDLGAGDAFADEVLVQDLITGTTEKAQSVFCRGRLVGFHAYRQVAAGVGGGEAIKQSVSRPHGARAISRQIGGHLGWHGALSVDIIMPDDGTAPLLIDCNPRLVEPGNAYRAGIDLVGYCCVYRKARRRSRCRKAARACSRIWRCRRCSAAHRAAARGGDIIRECGRLFTASGPYAGSREELTPVRLDWFSAVPLAMTAAFLLASP